MKSIIQLRYWLVAAAVLASASAIAQSIPGIPEPGLIMYGSITNSTTGQPLFNGAVNWQISGGGDSASVSATFVSVNGKSFYVARVPFETRSIPGVTFTKTPGTIGLTPAGTYIRVATVDGTNATTVPPSLSSFSFGASDRGRIDRVDLRVTLMDPNRDSDGDGMPDWAEAIAGTDPNDKNSVFKANTDIQPSAQGGLVIRWASVAGRTYAVYRTSDLGAGFILLQSGISATAPLNSYTDATATATAPDPFFIGSPFNSSISVISASACSRMMG